MVSSTLRKVVQVFADLSPFNKDMDAAEARENAFVRKWDRDSRRIHSEMSRVFRAIRGVMRTVQASFDMIGIALTPVAEAIIAAIGTTLTSILTIHRSLEAGTMGIAGAATIGLSVIAIDLAIMNVINTQAGFDDAQMQIQNASRLVDSLIAISLPGTFGGGYYY